MRMGAIKHAREFLCLSKSSMFEFANGEGVVEITEGGNRCIWEIHLQLSLFFQTHLSFEGRRTIYSTESDSSDMAAR